MGCSIGPVRGGLHRRPIGGRTTGRPPAPGRPRDPRPSERITAGRRGGRGVVGRRQEEAEGVPGRARDRSDPGLDALADGLEEPGRGVGRLILGLGLGFDRHSRRGRGVVEIERLAADPGGRGRDGPGQVDRRAGRLAERRVEGPDRGRPGGSRRPAGSGSRPGPGASRSTRSRRARGSRAADAIRDKGTRRGARSGIEARGTASPRSLASDSAEAGGGGARAANAWPRSRAPAWAARHDGQPAAWASNSGGRPGAGPTARASSVSSQWRRNSRHFMGNSALGFFLPPGPPGSWAWSRSARNLTFSPARSGFSNGPPGGRGAGRGRPWPGGATS